MGRKKTHHQKAAAGQDVARRAEAAAVEGDTHADRVTNESKEVALPREGQYTLAYVWNAGNNIGEPVEGSSQLLFSWRGRVGTIDGYDSTGELDYKDIGFDSAAGGEKVAFYRFEQPASPGSGKSPNVWALEVTPRPYNTSDGTKELCTVGSYAAGSPVMQVEGLATRDK